jgi:hypothetical protein
MTHLPVSRDLQPLPQTRASRPASRPWARFIEAFNSSDLPVIVAICLAGLLIMLNFMFRHPDIGALIEQYNLF